MGTPVFGGLIPGQHQAQFFAANDMDMQVGHILAAILAGVRDQAIAVLNHTGSGGNFANCAGKGQNFSV
jgi:hypothetical protein